MDKENIKLALGLYCLLEEYTEYVHTRVRIEESRIHTDKDLNLNDFKNWLLEKSRIEPKEKELDLR